MGIHVSIDFGDSVIVLRETNLAALETDVNTSRVLMTGCAPMELQLPSIRKRNVNAG